jgi:MFS family permease
MFNSPKGKSPSVSIPSPESDRSSLLPSPDNNLLSNGEVNDTDQLPSLPTRQLLSLCAFTLGYNVLIFNLVVIIAPDQVGQVSDDRTKGSALGWVTLYGGLVNLVGSVIIGAVNDMVSPAYGKRKPLFVLGTLCLAVSMYFLLLANSVGTYSLLYSIVLLFTACASTPYNALLVDYVSTKDKPRLSTILGAMSLAGNLIGAVLGVAYSKIESVHFMTLMNILLLTTGYLTARAIPKADLENVTTVNLGLFEIVKG